MGTFTVKHRGEEYEVDAPDEASAQQKLNDHLGKQQESESTLTKVMRNINEKLGIRSDAAVNPPGLSSAFVKGAPIIGNMVPQTANLTDLEQNHPWMNKAANIAGGAAILGGPTVAASKLAAAKIGPGMVPEMAAQTGLGLGVNTADKIAEKGINTTPKDLKNSAMMSVLQGVAGPLAGKAISPTFNSNRYTIDQLAAKFSEKELERNLTHSTAKEATKEAVKAALEHPVTGAALGALGGHLAMGNPLLGAGIGLAAKPVVQGASHVMSNKFMHDPSHQAILNILAQQQSMQTNR